MSKIDLSNYIPVNERLEKFYNDFPSGRVLTEIIEHDRENGFVAMKASVYRETSDTAPSATGHAFEERHAANSYVNKTSYIENCETSAVGRALALLGYEIKRGIASREEMEKVQRYESSKTSTGEARQTLPQSRPPAAASANGNDAPSEAQLSYLQKLCDTRALSEIDIAQEFSDGAAKTFERLTKRQASEAINEVQKR